jgi:hypothetical protein
LFTHSILDYNPREYRIVKRAGAIIVSVQVPNDLAAFLEALGKTEEPMAMFYTDKEPENGVSPKPGRLPSIEQEARQEIDFKELFKDFSCVIPTCVPLRIFSRAESEFMLLPSTVWGGDHESSDKSVFTFV